MAGHSQFKNIMHRKGRQDAAKSKLFGKLAREITVSAKIGLPDPAMNPRLRAAIIAARAENMPKDNIERAIKKAQGGEGESYEQIRYEGYGPGGVAARRLLHGALDIVLRHVLGARRLDGEAQARIEGGVRLADLRRDRDLAGELREELGAHGVLLALAMHDILELGMTGHQGLRLARRR